MVKKSKKSKNIVTINWEEEEGGKFISNPGEYVVKAVAAETNEDDEGRTYIKWTFQVTTGKGKGATISTNTYITPKALWKLRELLECMGIEIGNSVQDLDLDEAIKEGSEFVIEVEEGNERGDGKGYYMQVSDFMALEDYEEASSNMNNKKGESDEEDEDDETEEKEPVSKSSKKSKEADEEGSKSKKSKSKKVDEEDLLDQMEEEIDELGLDIDLDDYDTFAEKKKAFEKAKAEATEDEDSEDEEGEQVYTVEEIEALGTKQLKAIAEEIGLELDEEASTRSKRRSVIAGLRKAGLLDE